MAVFDTIKQEREKLKGKPFKEKLDHFIEYYKWHVIVIAFLAALIGGTIYQKATEPDIYLTGVLFNSKDLTGEGAVQGIIDGFSGEQGLEPGKETILLHTNLTYFEGEGYAASNYESMQILSTWVLAGEVDFIIGDASLMRQLAGGGYLTELPSGNDWQTESPYLLDVSGSEALKSLYGDAGDTLTLGITVSTENTERVLAFIDYLGE